MFKYFIDTNILVYSIDKNDPKKQKIARQIISEVDKNASGVISTQVLQEFVVTATKKLGVNPIQAKQVIKLFQFELILVDQEIIENAIDIQLLNKISFWDALILSSAVAAKCNYLISEDLNSDQVISGVKIVNPFSKKFTLSL